MESQKHPVGSSMGPLSSKPGLVHSASGKLQKQSFFLLMDLLGMEPRTFHMLGKHSTLKLHPQPLVF